jgi:hypothetical protein
MGGVGADASAVKPTPIQTVRACASGALLELSPDATALRATPDPSTSLREGCVRGYTYATSGAFATPTVPKTLR